MKQYRHPICIFLMLIPLFTCCEKVIDIDLDEEQILVVNGEPSAGRQLFVNISRAQFFLDDDNQHPVDDAQLTLVVNGIPMTPGRTQGCNYFFDYTVQADDDIALELHADGKTVTAHTHVPQIPVITNYSAAYDTTSTAFNMEVVNFTLHDNPDTKDYYYIAIAERDSGARFNTYDNVLDTVDTTFNAAYFCLTPKITQAYEHIIDNIDIIDILTVTDSLFNGESINVDLWMILFKDTNEVAPFLHEFTLQVYTMSPELFRYQKDIQKNDNITSMLAEPFQVYSNLSGNATGIFGGIGQYERRIEIDTANAIATRPPDSILKQTLRLQKQRQNKKTLIIKH